MSRKWFLHLCLAIAVILAGLAAPLFQPSVAVAAPPDTPSNISPSDGATGVTITPTLVCDNFSDPDGDSHLASDWQITWEEGNYNPSRVVFESPGDTSNLTSITVPPLKKLDYSTTYWWRVGYYDNTTSWSGWSAEWSFTTVAAPQADFSANRIAVVTGQTINFTDNSSGGVAPLSYQWDFGDGSPVSTVQNPSHSYSNPGPYSVALTVTDAAAGQNTLTKTNYIAVSAGVLAGFAADRTAVAVGQTVQFTNLSVGGVTPLTCEWDFNNDNVTDSTAQSPLYIYPSAGTYTVVLKVTDNAANTATETKPNYITVTAGLLADFSADKTSVGLGEGIQFTNLSGGGVAPLGYQWDFNNDGTWDSTAQSPSYTYGSAGTYTVVLKVTDNATNMDTETKTDYVTTLTLPVISGVNATSIVATSATIVWITNEETTSQVEYGLTTDYGSMTALDTTPVTSHSVILTGLTPYRTYHYKVKSRSVSGFGSELADFTFTTTDDTAPSKPVVTDDGASATSPTELHATWTSSDPESGIAEYQYVIGTTAGGTDVVSWTSVGTDTEVTQTGLTLTWGAVYYFSVKAKNGQGTWSSIGSSNGIGVTDATPPSTPVVTDDGGSTTSTSQLHAAWTSDDPESGINRYQYAIGTTAGGTDVVGWTSVGTSVAVTRTGLTLTVGVTYFFSVRARNEDGLWSSAGVSDGILVSPEGKGQGDISEAGGTVQTADGKITARFPADVVVGTVTVTIEQIAQPLDTSPPDGFEARNPYFVIEVTDAGGKAVVTFSGSIAITVRYSEADVAAAGGNPRNLVLAYWDEASGEWKVLETRVNTTIMMLSASTSHLSTWAVLARTTPAASDGLPPWVWLLCLLAAVAVVVPAVLILARRWFSLKD